MPGDKCIVEKQYVHKSKDENVFLRNLRRELPQTVEKEFFENQVKNAVSGEEFRLLQKYYAPDLLMNDASAPNPRPGGYVLQYLPAIRTLSAGAYDVLSAAKKFPWEKELLGKLYTREKGAGGDCYRLREDISEPYDHFIISSFKGWDLFINADDRTAVSAVLERVPELPKRNVFFANMFVNSAHPYFFEHQYDHVPSLMLIETVKQFILACSHTYGRVPLQGTCIIVDAIDCRFMNFININYPVLLKSTTLGLRVNRQGHWKYQKVRVEVFQGSKSLAIFTFSGNCISYEVLRTIREDQIEELRQSRFIPLHSDDYRLELRPEGSDRKVPARIVNLSVEGISVEVKTEDLPPGNGNIELSLSRADRGPVNGRYRKVWEVRNNGHVVLGMRSLKLGESDLKNLYDLICRDCMVQESRGAM